MLHGSSISRRPAALAPSHALALYEKVVDGGTAYVTRVLLCRPLLLAKMAGARAYYLHGDGVGSTRVVTDSSLTVKFSASYHPYGVAYSVTGTELFRYTDKLRESVTGLYYSMARWYDPQVGRFVSEDAYGGTLSDPMSLNRYAYARDNPMTLVDTNGNDWWDPFVAVTGAISMVVNTVSSSITTTISTINNGWNSMPMGEQHAIIESALIAAAAVVTVASLGVLSPLAVPMVGAALGSAAYTASAGQNANPRGAAIAGIVGGITAWTGGYVANVVAASTATSIIGPILTRSIPVLFNVLETTAEAAATGQTSSLNPASMTIDALTGTDSGGAALGSQAASTLADQVTPSIPLSSSQTGTAPSSPASSCASSSDLACDGYY